LQGRGRNEHDKDSGGDDVGLDDCMEETFSVGGGTERRQRGWGALRNESSRVSGSVEIRGDVTRLVGVEVVISYYLEDRG